MIGRLRVSPGTGHVHWSMSWHAAIITDKLIINILAHPFVMCLNVTKLTHKAIFNINQICTLIFWPFKIKVDQLCILSFRLMVGLFKSIHRSLVIINPLFCCCTNHLSFLWYQKSCTIIAAIQKENVSSEQVWQNLNWRCDAANHQTYS